MMSSARDRSARSWSFTAGWGFASGWSCSRG